MASSADGHIRIDTAIDNSGYKAGSKELSGLAQRLADKVENVGRSAEISLQKQTNAFVKQNEQYRQQLEKVERLRQAQEELSGQRVETDAYQSVTKEAQRTLERIDRLEQRQEDFLDSGGNANTRGYQQREMQLQRLREQYAEGPGDGTGRNQHSGGRYGQC